MDWQRFLEENNIHFVTRGPNTKRGEMSIHCPLCGPDDPSEHLGINPTSGFWGCLRDQSHRGKSARTLVKLILGCSSTQAGLIVKQYSHSDPDTLEAVLESLGAGGKGTILRELEAQEKSKYLDTERQFNAFTKIRPRGITKRFFQYLVARGYNNPKDIIEYYDLRCALTGRYKDRIIIPVRHAGELLGWTSRAIAATVNAPRYLASSEDVKTTLFNYDELVKGGERLFIVEGPFDAIRMDSFGLEAAKVGEWDPNLKMVDYRATCTFGTSVAISQIVLLRTLVKKFDETYILFDKGAEGPANNLADWTGAKLAYLPHGVDDPGDLEDFDLSHFSDRMYKGWHRMPRIGRKASKQIAEMMAKNNALLQTMLSGPAPTGVSNKSTFWSNKK